MDSTIPACPHCGSTAGFYRKRRAYGWAEEWFSKEGIADVFEKYDVNYSDSQTIRCASCDKVRRDVEVVNGRVAARR